jgi:hypothetical protein
MSERLQQGTADVIPWLFYPTMDNNQRLAGGAGTVRTPTETQKIPVNMSISQTENKGKGKGKGHPCTRTEALYRLYGP